MGSGLEKLGRGGRREVRGRWGGLGEVGNGTQVIYSLCIFAFFIWHIICGNGQVGRPSWHLAIKVRTAGYRDEARPLLHVFRCPWETLDFHIHRHSKLSLGSWGDDLRPVTFGWPSPDPLVGCQHVPAALGEMRAPGGSEEQPKTSGGEGARSLLLVTIKT